MAKSQSAGRQMLSLLEGRSCGFCDGGALERAEYKGNEAVVCDQCGTPRAQLW